MVSATAPMPAPLPASATIQRPSLAMPISVTSYRLGSRERSTFAADALDTSCSAERPPNRIATLVLRSAIVSLLVAQPKNAAFCLHLVKRTRPQFGANADRDARRGISASGPRRVGM